MLSYRHAFHAGNHADVLKHAVQALIIESLKKKEKPFIVLDTHAGGGLYDLRGDWSQKKAEYADGIGRLWDERAQWSAMAPYLGVIEEMNRTMASCTTTPARRSSPVASPASRTSWR